MTDAPKHAGGRPPNAQRVKWMKKLRMKHTRPCEALPLTLIDQLERCKDTSAQRLLTGKSRKMLSGKTA